MNRQGNVKHRTCWKSKALGKKIWRKALALKSNKVQGIFGETFILALLSSAAFRLQNCVSDFFNLLCSRDKRLLAEFLRKWGWFQRHNERFPKTETGFYRWRSTDNNDIKIFLSLENPCTFLLPKEKTWKRIFNTNSELSQARTGKQIMIFKTTINWLFNDIWCYLLFACFDWKIGLF